jgi:hypothetical protein
MSEEKQRYRVVLWGGYYQVTRTDNTSAGIAWDERQASRICAFLNQETAPLLERIAELEAALEANKRSSFIVWDTTIHEMRGKLQSIHSTATHALKKAGGNE